MRPCDSVTKYNFGKGYIVFLNYYLSVETDGNLSITDTILVSVSLTHMGRNTEATPSSERVGN